MNVDKVLTARFEQILNDASWLNGGAGQQKVVGPSSLVPARATIPTTFPNVLLVGGVIVFVGGMVGMIIRSM